jgi:5,10-methylene-tetrahydrofolate dehydrogenase/methenyl tetrahydrofolate cyclohydrolase
MKINTVVADGLKLSRLVFESSHQRFKKAKAKFKCSDIPTLAVISTYSRADSISYIKKEKKLFKEMGFKLEVVKIPRDCTAVELAHRIEYLNSLQGVHGIQLHMPLPLDAIRHTKQLVNYISPDKDVEGLTTLRNQQMLASPYFKPLEDSDIIAPCTALATLQVLNSYGVDCLDKRAVVLGSSFVTGCPISTMLEKIGAKVTMCDRNTQNVPSLIKKADILVSAVGKPDMFDLGLVKPGAVVLDLGFCDHGGKIRGDIDSDKLIGRASLITPVPRGIGPITSSMVVRNLILLWEAHAKKQDHCSSINDRPTQEGPFEGQRRLSAR